MSDDVPPRAFGLDELKEREEPLASRRRLLATSLR